MSLPRTEDIALLKEVQIKVLREFSENSRKEGLVNTKSESSENLADSLKGSKKAPFADFLFLFSNHPNSRIEKQNTIE